MTRSSAALLAVALVVAALLGLAAPARAASPDAPVGQGARTVPDAPAAPGAAVLPAARLAAAAPTPAAALPPDALVLTVEDLRPRAPRPGDDLQVVGTLLNTGSEPLTALELRVRTGRRLASRSDLAEADRTPPTYGSPRTVRQLADLAPGASAPLDLRMPVDDLRLAADGAYPLLLEVRGVTGEDERDRVGQVSTYLPWFGTTVVDPLRIAWLWPVVDQPRRGGAGEVLVDDVLATSLTPQGRLGRSLAAARAGESGTCAPAAEPAPDRPPAPATSPTPPAPAPCRPVPVTYAVDPELVQTAEVMSAGYEVPDPAGTRPGEGAGAAADWLGSLRAGVAAGDLLALPYADPDVVALTRSGALAADVAAAQTYGSATAADLLEAQPLRTVAYPPPGRLTDAAFDALTSGTTSAVVLEADALADTATPRSTPGARVSLPPSSTSGAATGLVVDRGLSDLLVPAAPQPPRLAEQRWLVETAMISAELPSRGRTLLVAPPRRGEVDPAVAGAAVADTGQVPWMCPVRLEDVVAGRESCPGATVPEHAPERTAQLAQPDAATPALSADLLARVGRLRTAATQLTGSIIKGGTEQAQATRAQTQRAWLRGESSAWRDDPQAGARLVALAADDVARQRAQVSVLTGSILLTSNRGRVDVAVVNELDQPVTVALRLTAPSDARLSRTQTDVLEVPARFRQTVPLDAQTLTSGRFVVRAQLLDRDGVPFGEPKELLVRSTRYGSVALAVTGVGAGVLLVAAVGRLVRRARRRTVAA